MKRVTNAGTIRLKHKLLFLAHPLIDLPVGLDETGDGIWSIYFSNVLIGRVDERENAYPRLTRAVRSCSCTRSHRLAPAALGNWLLLFKVKKKEGLKAGETPPLYLTECYPSSRFIL